MRRRFRLAALLLAAAGLAATLSGPRPIDLAAAVNLEHWRATGDWLAGDHTLDHYAYEVAERLADTGTLKHSDIGTLLGCPWVGVAENIGVGPDLPTIIAAWLASPTHAANIAADYTHLGVGLVQRAGRVWVVTVFAK